MFAVSWVSEELKLRRVKYAVERSGCRAKRQNIRRGFNVSFKPLEITLDFLCCVGDREVKPWPVLSQLSRLQHQLDSVAAPFFLLTSSVR